MTKRASGKFKRRPQDAYDTPPEAVLPLLPHLPDVFNYCEPCAGAGALIEALARVAEPWSAFDIKPRDRRIMAMDARVLHRTHVAGADLIISNPPWSRNLLHPMIEHFANLRPTWLLFDADWMHTKQAEPYGHLCHKVVSVGRVSWMQNGTSGFDNCAWYFFDANIPYDGTRFFFRASVSSLMEAA